MSKFCSLFTGLIKSVSPLDTRGQSVRNALVSLNKDMLKLNSFNPANLIVSRGGLPNIHELEVQIHDGGDGALIQWQRVTGPTITVKALLVWIMVNLDENFAAAEWELNSKGFFDSVVQYPAGATLHVYNYLLDYRGSSKVGSASTHQSVVVPD
jgi:hypothetical protein